MTHVTLVMEASPERGRAPAGKLDIEPPEIDDTHISHSDTKKHIQYFKILLG